MEGPDGEDADALQHVEVCSSKEHSEMQMRVEDSIQDRDSAMTIFWLPKSHILASPIKCCC